MNNEEKNSSGNESKSTSSDIDNKTNTVSLINVIPESSKRIYNSVYQQFCQWCVKNERNLFSQNTLLDYFEELSKKFKASTLWSHYSMLRSTMYFNKNVDISQFIKLRVFLRRKSRGYCPQKPSTFTIQDINRFLREAPDSKYLLAKVVLSIGLIGSCLREELRNLKVQHINDMGSTALVKIPTRKKGKSREFMLTGYFYKYYKKYAALRPPYTKDSSFFVNYQNDRCTAQNVGINKIGGMGKAIASYLNLPNPELYTAHCFRETAKLQHAALKLLSIVENTESHQMESEFEETIHIKIEKDIKTEYQDNITSSQNVLNLDSSLSQPKIERNNCISECTTSNEDDDDDEYFSIFAKYVASRLKRLKNPRLQTICQERINRVFFDLEMDKQSNND